MSMGASDIKGKVTIPRYFEDVIVPEMKDYYATYRVDFEYKPVVLCPLHSENTPSFRYYEETNTFYCFGCRVGGDVIRLHRKFVESRYGETITFWEAVKFLNDYFLRGVETADIKIVKEEENKMSSVAEVLVYSNYVNKLEARLIRDSSMGEDKKMEIYSTIDEMNILTSCNKINALEAIRFIKVRMG